MRSVHYRTMGDVRVRIVLDDRDQGGLGSVPCYRVSYTDPSSGERIRYQGGMAVSEWQALAEAGNGSDSKQAIDVVAQGAAEGFGIREPVLDW